MAGCNPIRPAGTWSQLGTYREPQVRATRTAGNCICSRTDEKLLVLAIVKLMYIELSKNVVPDRS